MCAGFSVSATEEAPTSEFTAVLRDQVGTTQRAPLAAQEASQPRQVYRHSARLLDRAARNGVDTTGWSPEATLSVAHANADAERLAPVRPPDRCRPVMTHCDHRADTVTTRHPPCCRPTLTGPGVEERSDRAFNADRRN